VSKRYSHILRDVK